MKWILFVMSLVFASTSSARIVCGVNIGNEPIAVMANQCRPIGIREFKKKFGQHPNYVRECVVDGKKIAVSVLVQYNFAAAFDFTSPETQKCRLPARPASFEEFFDNSNQDPSSETGIEI